MCSNARHGGMPGTVAVAANWETGVERYAIKTLFYTRPPVYILATAQFLPILIKLSTLLQSSHVQES